MIIYAIAGCGEDAAERVGRQMALVPVKAVFSGESEKEMNTAGAIVRFGKDVPAVETASELNFSGDKSDSERAGAFVKKVTERFKGGERIAVVTSADFLSRALTQALMELPEGITDKGIAGALSTEGAISRFDVRAGKSTVIEFFNRTVHLKVPDTEMIRLLYLED